MECMRQLMHWFVVYPRSWKAYHLNVSRGEWSPCECKILVLTRTSSKVKSTDCRCIFSSMHGPSYSCFILHIILYLVLVLSYKFSVFPPWSNFGRREQSERPQLTVSVSVCTLGVLWMVVDWGCVWHTCSLDTRAPKTSARAFHGFSNESRIQDGLCTCIIMYLNDSKWF